ncbi:MAG TPA: adenylate/guanylate cyclase domain-containing protein [Candidatus Limnocylindria bacterium]|nr:adenylate/guanylate cyclase domain-containing protein [Candidatus Limnocylindria bacterium]
MQEQAQERRLVTVLFADFAGFTQLADQMDPEELQVLVSGIFEDLAEEAVANDGTIEKFIGDAVFVIFGAPVAHEDDPQRALRTALAMQRVFAEHAKRVKAERDVELGLRIGIHTGMVVAGSVRSVAEYGVMGDTVNTASRIQAAAGPGESYVTQTTFRLTNREFHFREVGPIDVKGKEKPILVYALTGERTDVRPALDVAAPLVGRWMELSRLDLAYQSSRLGHTEVVLIAGEPGIGKSRLLSEFTGLATASEEGTKTDESPRVMRWTFSRVNQRAYAGFMEALLVELQLDATAADAQERLAERLGALGFANPLMVAPILAQFLHLPGAPEPATDTEEWKRSMFIAVYDVIAALARERPLLYILEDLHFADAASLDLLWFLASRASRVPILFLLAQRIGPGTPEPHPSRTNFTQLVLEPLSDEEAARIVEATFDWMPDELRDRIVARAGGNPFFIEESLRSLVESGAIEKDSEGEWRLRERPSVLEVPATLHAVVAARIDRLEPTARECIQLASVIGQRFGDRVLREAGGNRIADGVDQLIAADLVLEAAPGERREGRYRFKHAVVQEVAYNTLLVRRRAELHRRVAVAYEAVLNENELREFYPALAHHYLLGDVPDKAVEYSWQAAQRATAIHAYVEALRFAEQALELFEKLKRIDPAVEALYLIARVRRYRGEVDGALAAYERALVLLEGRDPNAPEVATVLAHMAEVCTRWDAKHPDLQGIIDRGLAIVNGKRNRDKVLLLAANAFMARKRPKVTDADWEASLATAKEALAIAEELGLLREVSLCLDAIGYAYGELGNFRQSYAHNQRRLPIAKSLQDNDELIDAHTMVAVASLVLGNFNEVLENAVVASEIAAETEKPRLGSSAVQIEAYARLLSGDFPGTLEAAARRERMMPLGKPYAALVVASAAAAAMGLPDEKTFRERLVELEAAPVDIAACDFLTSVYGQREAESSYRAIRSAGYPKGSVDIVVVGPLAVLAAARWRIDDPSFVERIEAAVERAGHARGRALLVHAEGLRALTAGEHTKAAKLIFDAVQSFATLKLDYERAVALGDLARALHGSGRRDQAQAQCDEAKAIADRLHAVALRAILDQALVAA